jgi:hypothetical protein
LIYSLEAGTKSASRTKNTKTTYMAQIRSKQISDFLAQVNWATVKTTEIPNAFDVDARFDTVESDLVDESAARGAADSALSASVDSLETALSAEIEATNTDVTELYAALSAEADTRETEMNTHHDEHVSLITAESGRAIAAEGFLGASVDSLEVAVSIESERINAILDGSTVDLDQFAEVVSYVNGLDLVNDNSFISRETFVDGRLNRLDSSVDSLESALAGEIEATNGDVTAINASIDSLENKAGTDVSALIASVDSLEGVDADLQQAINSLEEKHNDEMNTHHLEHVSLITAEEERAIAAEGFLGASVDSLELALANEIEATNTDVTALYAAIDAEEGRAGAAEGFLGASVDSLELALANEIEATNTDVTALYAAINTESGRAGAAEGFLGASVDSLEVAVSIESERINAILDGSTVDLDQFAEVVSYVQGLDLVNDNSFISRELYVNNYLTSLDASVDSLETALAGEIEATNDDVTAIGASIDSLELALNNGSGALVDSVDSLELALAAEISTTNAEVAGINLSIDSLELALANEIEATNGDVLAIIDSVDSLELALTAETNLRIFGDTYAEVEVTGITAAAGPVVISSPVLFAEGSFDTEVYVNGLRVAFTQMNPNDFDLNLVYAIEASDIIRIVGVQA